MPVNINPNIQYTSSQKFCLEEVKPSMQLFAINKTSQNILLLSDPKVANNIYDWQHRYTEILQRDTTSNWHDYVQKCHCHL